MKKLKAFFWREPFDTFAIVLMIILIAMFFSGCSKPSYKRINMYVVDMGQGETSYKLYEGETYKAATLDTSFVVYGHDSRRYVFRLWFRNVITNAQRAEVYGWIEIDGVVVAKDSIVTSRCGDRQKLIRCEYP